MSEFDSPELQAQKRKYRNFKSALTRALNAKNHEAVIRQADAFERYYSEHGPIPDDWSRWQRARDDALLALRRTPASRFLFD